MSDDAQPGKIKSKAEGAVESAGDKPGLAAGGFSTWLRSVRSALLEDGVTDVPCGACTACCTSSYFVHIGPGETRALARIPAELLFPAPDLPQGNAVLGYDAHGHCPMLVDGACSIYVDRPLTCRLYDCRVFAAAGIAADRTAITRQARRCEFGYPTDDDRREYAAVRAAARFVRDRAQCFPGGDVPHDPAQLAVLAIKVYEVFLERPDEDGRTACRPSDRETAAAVMKASAAFEARRCRETDVS